MTAFEKAHNTSIATSGRETQKSETKTKYREEAYNQSGDDEFEATTRSHNASITWNWGFKVPNSTVQRRWNTLK